MFRDDGAGAPGGAGANDGVVQAGEPGVANAALELRAAACAGGVCDSTLTDGGGAFTLWFPAAAGGAAAQVVERDPGGLALDRRARRARPAARTRARPTRSRSPPRTARSRPASCSATCRRTRSPPAGAASVAPGGVALYPHTFTAASAGAVTLRAAQAPSPRDRRAGATSSCATSTATA